MRAASAISPLRSSIHAPGESHTASLPAANNQAVDAPLAPDATDRLHTPTAPGSCVSSSCRCFLQCPLHFWSNLLPQRLATPLLSASCQSRCATLHALLQREISRHPALRAESIKVL